jgi:hypothetical protein
MKHMLVPIQFSSAHIDAILLCLHRLLATLTHLSPSTRLPHGEQYFGGLPITLKVA